MPPPSQPASQRRRPTASGTGRDAHWHGPAAGCPTLHRRDHAAGRAPSTAMTGLTPRPVAATNRTGTASQHRRLKHVFSALSSSTISCFQQRIAAVLGSPAHPRCFFFSLFFFYEYVGSCVLKSRARVVYFFASPACLLGNSTTTVQLVQLINLEPRPYLWAYWVPMWSTSYVIQTLLFAAVLNHSVFAKKCQTWCHKNGNAWQAKCTWSACADCSECGE